MPKSRTRKKSTKGKPKSIDWGAGSAKGSGRINLVLAAVVLVRSLGNGRLHELLYTTPPGGGTGRGGTGPVLNQWRAAGGRDRVQARRDRAREQRPLLNDASAPGNRAVEGQSMAERQLKMGIIGIGVGAAEMLPAIDGAENIDLFAGADIDPDVRARFGERYPNARVYDSAEALCADPDVEAVWISTPNRFHAPMTILAARAGKHVVVEKPMALNLTEAEAMLQACDEHGVKLIAGHTMSFSPPIRYMRQIVRSGALGPLAAINVFA